MRKQCFLMKKLANYFAMMSYLRDGVLRGSDDHQSEKDYQSQILGEQRPGWLEIKKYISPTDNLGMSTTPLPPFPFWHWVLFNELPQWTDWSWSSTPVKRCWGDEKGCRITILWPSGLIASKCADLEGCELNFCSFRFHLVAPKRGKPWSLDVHCKPWFKVTATIGVVYMALPTSNMELAPWPQQYMALYQTDCSHSSSGWPPACLNDYLFRNLSWWRN